MKNHKNIFYALILFLGAVIWLKPSELSAQMTCTGNACQYLPYTQSQMDQTFFEMRNQVAKPLVDNYAKASAAANVMQPMIGTLGITGVTFGANMQGGVYESDAKDINIPNVGVMEDVQLSAAQVAPSAFVGINLGSLFGSSYDHTEDTKKERRPPAFSLARFDVYAIGLDYSRNEEQKNDGQLIGRTKYKVATKGFQIRYQMTYGSNWLGPILRWHGVSLMAGMIDTSTLIDYSDRRADHLKINLNQNGSIVWAGDFLVSKISSDVKSYPVEIHTGIQLLYFLNLTIGAGVSWNSGRSQLFLSKTGRATLESNVLSQISPNSTNASYLSFMLTEEGAPPAQLYYGKAGLEINLAFIKIGAQVMATQDNTYGGNITLRVQL